jgi:hypothetical protein
MILSPQDSPEPGLAGLNLCEFLPSIEKQHRSQEIGIHTGQQAT